MALDMDSAARQDEERDGFRFRVGHPALDLADTQGRMERPDDLARWLTAAGLAEPPVEVDAADLVIAHQLREAVQALAGALFAGEAFPAEARAAINRLAGARPAIPQLGEDGAARLIGDTPALLAELAREAIMLLSMAHPALMRQHEELTDRRIARG